MTKEEKEQLRGVGAVITLNQLMAKAEKLDELDLEIANLEEQLKAMKEEYKKLDEFTLPEMLMSIGMTEIKLEDGTKMTLSQYYSAKIPADKEAEAFKWLEETGQDAIIKSKVDLAFGKGESKIEAKVCKALDKLAVAYQRKRSIHPMTLKSFVKECIEEGKPLDAELFGVYIGNQVKIKRSK